MPLKSKEETQQAFTSLLANIIYVQKCVGGEDGFRMAKLKMENEKFLHKVIESFYEDIEIDKDKIVLTTKEIEHIKIYDREYNQNPEKRFDIGRAYITIHLANGNTSIEFDNKEFVHGHMNGKTVGCYGGYGNFTQSLIDNGPTATLHSIYAFCKHSRYGTHWRLEQPGTPNTAGRDYRGW